MSSVSRDESERESDHAHTFENRHPKCEHNTTRYIISLIESRIASSSRTSPAATRFTTCSGNLAISFTSTIFFLFIVSFCLVKGAFVCVDFVEKEKRGVSQLLKP